MSPATRKYRRVRSRTFRAMVGNVGAELRDRRIPYNPKISDLRMMWLTASNCAVIEEAAEDIKTMREEIFR